jgi:diguanylate cyclase (GGDEF)-like protein
MKFPSIGDIATKVVVTVDIDAQVSQAVDTIFTSRHRTALVPYKGEYFIFGASDILLLVTKNIDLSTPLKNLHLTKIPTILKHKNVLDTLDMINGSIEYIAVVNEDNSLFGIVTHTDITNNIDPETLMENYRLQDFLKLGRRMKWVSKEIITSELLEDIAMNSFDNAIIVEDLRPIGIITTKDVMRLVKEQADLSLPIEHYMSHPVETIHKDCSIKEALEFIHNKSYKRVVVVGSDGRLTGVITQKELISLTYSRWAVLMKEYQRELSVMNSTLESKAKEFELKASLDSLTGLYNRSKFSELYNLSYKTMLSRGTTMSLAMLDIDHFKKINDTYGHNTGDTILCSVAKTITDTLRNIDIVSRWGGEEFVVLLPTAGLSQGKMIAEKLRKAIECLACEPRVSVSIGVCEVRRGEAMLQAIERADKALYLAKHCGRNLVKCEDDSL